MSNVENFYWFEFLEKVDEELRLLENEVMQKESLIQSLMQSESACGEMEDLAKRCHIYLRDCEDIRNELENLDSKLNDKVPVGRKEYELLGEIPRLESSIHFLSVALNQRLEGFRAWQLIHQQPVLAEFGFQKVHKAATSVLIDFFQRIYGKKWLSSKDEPYPLLIFGPASYSVMSDLRMANVPWADIHRIRFWVFLGHESFHDKVHATLYGSNPPSFIDDMVHDISKLYHVIPREGDPGVALFMDTVLQQAEEIACDVGATMLTGPSDFHACTCAWTPECKDIDLGVELLLGDLVHPPSFARLKYILATLSKLNYPREEIEKFELELNNMPEERNPQTHMPSFFAKYASLVKDNYLEKIIRLVKDMVGEPQIYGGEKWKNAKDVYQKITEGQDIPSDTSVSDLLNVVWLKREDVLKLAPSLSKDVKSFKQWHKMERKIYDVVINYLARREVVLEGEMI